MGLIAETFAGVDIEKAKIKFGHQVQRLYKSYQETGEVRTGSCTPDKCSTLDGIHGNACCKLDGACRFLHSDKCGIYEFRPELRCLPALKRRFETSP